MTGTRMWRDNDHIARFQTGQYRGDGYRYRAGSWRQGYNQAYRNAHISGAVRPILRNNTHAAHFLQFLI